MASPQRPEFRGLSGAPRSGGAPQGNPPARSRATFLFGWLIAVVLVAIFFYWIAWGWGNSGGYWWHNRSQPATTSDAHPISGAGIAALDATDKQPFVGRHFQLSNVPIQRKVSNHIYWIGPNSQRPMLLVLNGNESSVTFSSLTPGKLVDVVGTVTKAPPVADAGTEWPLSEPGLAQLEKEGAYVSATDIHLASE